MPTPARPRWLIPAGAGVLTIALVAVLASIGNPADPLTSLSTIADLLVRAGAPALAYLAAAAGLGRLCSPLTRGSGHAGLLQVALGLGLLLSLSHLLGILGLLSRPVALGTVVLGIVLLGHQLAASREHARVTLSPAWLLTLPALALLLVAACNPPGWLWDSEAGGYDALSYHLQLPQEWLAAGRIWPSEHNVFSFQPCYVEAAFVHLGAMTGAPRQPMPGTPGFGLLAGDGLGVISCQLLSAGIALLAAALTAGAARAACRRAGVESPAATALAGAMLLCTPWAIVAGSLAYNDMALVALIAAALIAALDSGLTPARRGLIAGMLIGIASGCKPTALIFGAPPVGIALLATTPARQWAPILGAGAAAGVLSLAPWLIRNAIACGNPVFPEAAALFGPAHWAPDQFQRYHRAVSFNGSALDRLRLMFVPDLSDPAGPRHRGLFHRQWLAFFPVAAAAMIAALGTRATRRPALILSAGLASQLLTWLLATHIQSRFLLPLAVSACVLLALAVAGRRVAIGLAAAACLAQAVAAITIFSTQRRGGPNQLLVAGPALRTGAGFVAELAAMDPASRAAALARLPPEPFINLTWPGDGGGSLYLLGDATPLYFTVPLTYNTTWDEWPLARAMRTAPNDPAAWSRSLRDRGIRAVLVNFAEIDRLTRSGWIDPLVTGESAAAWLAPSARLVRDWPEARTALFELLPAPVEIPR